jgi:hypothetical protein
MSPEKMTESDVPILVLLRCVGTPPGAKCASMIEAPIEVFSRPVPSVRDETGKLVAATKSDGLAAFLFKNGKWLLSMLTKGQGRATMGPLCPACVSKAYPPALLKAAHEHLGKLGT